MMTNAHRPKLARPEIFLERGRKEGFRSKISHKGDFQGKNPENHEK